jgi:hypothetical protein
MAILPASVGWSVLFVSINWPDFLSSQNRAQGHYDDVEIDQQAGLVYSGRVVVLLPGVEL